jgi:hypothetical protein
VNGTGIVAASVVNWNGSPLTTTFVSATQLTAAVTAAQIATVIPVNVTVVNPGPVISNSVAFTITPPLTITSTSPLASGTVEVPYSQTLVATGGTLPYNWSVTTGTLPSSLTLNPTTGAITGTPTAAGSFSFFVQVADSGSQTATKSFTITIAAGLVVTTSSLPGGTVGVAYSQTLAAAGGTPPYSWSITVGAPPPGLTLDGPTGVISGTPTTSAGSPFSFTVQVTDSLSATASKALSVSIAPALSITTSSLPGGNVGTPYSQTLVATGGTLPYNWSVTAGALPAGLTLDASTGIIGGTPSAAGTSSFTVGVTDRLLASTAKALSITIAPALTITTSSPLPAGMMGKAYAVTLAASGGTPPYGNWQIATGALPGGLTLDTASGTISGTPNTSGTFGFIAQVSDSLTVTTTKAFSLTINPALTITTASLATGVVGTSYSQPLAASGGASPYSWSVTAGALPGGITLNASTGLLSGAPAAAGSFPFTAQVADSAAATATKGFVLTVVAAVTITNASPLPSGAVSNPYAVTLVAAGGTAPYTWSITAGALPAGLTLNATTGVISGMPYSAGFASFTARVADSLAAAATKALSITIASALSITTVSPLPAGTMGKNYSVMLAATGGTLPYGSWQILTGSLPGGLTLAAFSGVISGIPVASGVFGFVVQVVDSAAVTATRFFSLTINPALSITTASLPPAVAGVSYSQALAATGGVPPYVWSVALGALPAGITLNPLSGVLGGTPSVAGSFSFTIQVADTAAATAVREYTLTVAAGLTITTPTQLSSGALSTPYQATLAASGGKAPYTWSLASGSLPAGLTISPGAGVISGTPTAAGNFSFVVQVADSAGVTASRAMTLAILSSLTIASTSQLAAGTVGAGYSHTLTVTGGAPPYAWTITSGQLPASLTLNSSTGVISGTLSAAGSFSFTVRVSDSTGQSATQALTLTVAAVLAVTSETPLPNGVVGSSYSFTLAASGGTPPYVTWTVTAGFPPAGLSLDPATGTISGTPTLAATFNFTVQVRDTAGKTATKALVLTIAPAALVIATASPLPRGVYGTAYAHTLEATGGALPYAWSLSSGAPPEGLTLEVGGRITGTPAAVGAATFTVQVADGTRKTAAKSFTLAVDPPPTPPVQVTGAADLSDPAAQASLKLSLAQAFPLEITGQMTLSFQPDAVNPADDPAIQFSTGGRTVAFRIPADSTDAAFSAGTVALQTGTVAGTITLRVSLQAGGQDITPAPAPTQTVQIRRLAPVIRSVRLTRTSSGFDVLVTGFSTPREVTSATFRFSSAPDANLQTAEVTLPMTELAGPWYQSQESWQFGSQFTLRQSFTVQGDINAVAAVSVVLTNSVGSSQAVSASF